MRNGLIEMDEHDNREHHENQAEHKEQREHKHRSPRANINVDKRVLGAAAVVASSIATFFDPAIGFVLFVVLLAAMYFMKIADRSILSMMISVFMIFLVFFFFFLFPSMQIASGSGTVMNDNWWAALNWIGNNTDKDSVIATYWDFGHFITSVGRRAVVFDGASQSDLYTRPSENNLTGQFIERYDKSIDRILVYKNGSLTTARIKDISSVLLTGNETLALEILKDYRKNETGDMYFIASADLMSKSFWWSYFATWSPVEEKGCNADYMKGKCYTYAMLNLGGTSRQQDGSTVFSYPFSQNQGFLVIDLNGTLTAYSQVNGQLLKVQKIFYYDALGQGVVNSNADGQVGGLVVVDPSRQLIIYTPPELEDSLFTRMYFFNGKSFRGEPLEHFELVGSWGGEIKIFKVSFPEGM